MRAHVFDDYACVRCEEEIPYPGAYCDGCGYDPTPEEEPMDAPLCHGPATRRDLVLLWLATSGLTTLLHEVALHVW
jgi:hypothetical protein